MGLVVTAAFAADYVFATRAAGDIVAFTNGCFDLLHVGHLAVINRASYEADHVVVGVNDDESFRRVKGRAPIVCCADRCALVAAMRPVDLVVPFGEDDPGVLVRAIRPDVLLKGADWNPEDVVGADDAGRLVLVPLIEGASTSEIIRRCRALPEGWDGERR